MRLIGRVVCLFKGHKRGVFSGEAFLYKYFKCPRCGRETRYKVKDQNHGTPGDQA